MAEINSRSSEKIITAIKEGRNALRDVMAFHLVLEQHRHRNAWHSNSTSVNIHPGRDSDSHSKSCKKSFLLLINHRPYMFAIESPGDIARLHSVDDLYLFDHLAVLDYLQTWAFDNEVIQISFH